MKIHWRIQQRKHVRSRSVLLFAVVHFSSSLVHLALDELAAPPPFIVVAA